MVRLPDEMEHKTMSNSMTRWGVGPKLGLITVIYAAIVFLLNYFYFPFLRFTLLAKAVNIMLGIVLIGTGISILVFSVFTVKKYFHEEKFLTKGVYSFLRHPIYGAWITFIVPGIVIWRGSVLGVSIPVFMYAVFRVLILQEEQYLETKFGEEYLEYKRKVGMVFPKFWKWSG
jgi:protein-S-isoprenylcysteine O-methyltransferase Ste14